MNILGVLLHFTQWYPLNLDFPQGAAGSQIINSALDGNFTNSFFQQIFFTCLLLRTILGVWDTSANRKSLPSRSLHLVKETDNKQ